ncbi:MAG: hypothetical protein R2771_03440 [Saprospiraceae bacterium]
MRSMLYFTFILASYFLFTGCPGDPPDTPQCPPFCDTKDTIINELPYDLIWHGTI